MRSYLFLPVILIFFTQLSFCQQAGIREVYGGGYRFDAEKYKIDVELTKLRNNMNSYHQPSKVEFKFSSEPKVVKSYRTPKYPKDTLVWEVNEFKMQSNQISPSRYMGKLEKGVQESDTLLLTNGDKFYKVKPFGINTGFVVPGWDYLFNSNESIHALVRNTGESDKKYFGLWVDVQLSVGYNSYYFWVNDKGQFKIDECKWNKQFETIKTGKIKEYVPEAVNEIAIQKTGEKLIFLCGGNEVYSITLEHPWTNIAPQANLIVEKGGSVSLHSYRFIWYPY